MVVMLSGRAFQQLRDVESREKDEGCAESETGIEDHVQSVDMVERQKTEHDVVVAEGGSVWPRV